VATSATILQNARLGAGSVAAVGALVHAGTAVPAEFFVPPQMMAIGTPPQLFAPGDSAATEAIGKLGFSSIAFGVDTAWTDRLQRYEQITEVRSAEFAAHAQDERLHDDA
jgi:carbonic anhydrase/acetyltransferase-like protein (isoleucine patch superfamily)